MNLIKAVASLNKRNQWWKDEQAVVVAVSTGVDSMSLLDVLQSLRFSRPKIVVAYVNHHLRSSSDQEEQFLVDYCHQHQLILERADWNIHPQTGIENAAREFRYQFFKNVLAKYSATVLLTAHHKNDQAETMLMRLISGGPLGGLTGIKSQRIFGSAKLVRPFLHFKKVTIRNFATQRQLTWFEDETNFKNDVFRNRIRNQILPELEHENGKTVDHLANYAKQLALLLSANQELLAPILAKIKLSPNELDILNLKKYSTEIQRELIIKFIQPLVSVDLKPTKITEIMELVQNDQKPNGEVSLAKNWRIIKTYQKIILQNGTKFSNDDVETKRFMVILNQWQLLNSKLELGIWDFDHSDNDRKGFTLFLSPKQLPLQVRPWRSGDRIMLRGNKHKRISRIFIDQKVPLLDRKQGQVLVDNNGTVLALLGYQNGYQREQKSKSRYLMVLKRKGKD